MNKISFISNRPWLTKKSDSSPSPASKYIPNWFIDADRYVKDNNNKYYVDQEGGKIPSWKACPALYDILTTGYFLRTPCDIEFKIIENKLFPIISDTNYQDFIQVRNSMPGFPTPVGYHEEHFAWWPDWGTALPEGNCLLYSHPFNRFDLPFLNTTGIVDQDKIDLPGTVPFFIKKGWEGTIPSGTPFLQLLPFERSDWESEYIELNADDIIKRNIRNSKKYRKPDGGIYLNKVWSRRKYL